LGHGARQVAVAVLPLGRSGDLDFDDQQGQGDSENRITEAFEAAEPALGTMRSHVVALAGGLRWHQRDLSKMSRPRSAVWRVMVRAGKSIRTSSSAETSRPFSRQVSPTSEA